MSSYCYEAVDSSGVKIEGTLEVGDQSEALRRIKEMGLFPTKLAEAARRRRRVGRAVQAAHARRKFSSIQVPFLGRRVKPATLATFTRQLATLVEAGMPLLRGLRILEEQEENATLKQTIRALADSIEGGSSLSESLARFPRIFTPLYVNMVKAGEVAGALEVTLCRLAEVMEKAQKIKGKIRAALFYPVAVMVFAMVIVGVMMVYVVPKFREVLQGLTHGGGMPWFSELVFGISRAMTTHLLWAIAAIGALIAAFVAAVHTPLGRRIFDRFKLTVPVIGPVFRKAAISRFARTLGTLLQSGVPILQALTIVKETAGNVIVGDVISKVHESVKEGDTIAVPLKVSGVFPAMVAGMVDVGEQTGALPDMLMKVAEGYDDQVDNAVTSMTSLLEPIMIVFLAVVVGSIVIALFLPIVGAFGDDTFGDTRGDG